MSFSFRGVSFSLLAAFSMGGCSFIKKITRDGPTKIDEKHHVKE
jgi:hypothetical protein